MVEHQPVEMKAEDFDRDVSLRGVLLTGLGIVLGTVLAMVAMWYMGLAFRDAWVAGQRELTPVEEARRNEILRVNDLRRLDEDQERFFPQLVSPLDVALPPEPRVQVSPGHDMERFSQSETQRLESYGWVDRRAGIARVPIERAIDEVVRRGVPWRGAPQESQEGSSAVEEGSGAEGGELRDQASPSEGEGAPSARPDASPSGT